ncbi:hypothetical protein COLO4_22119 [Corchorus olitorius]|uniref:Uncharacterized protein n=1 Tax=Corchorus olitorius TaxID=93759 RepID=A0A1R3INZ7_9ROSI|nr:hypothetical protein COLO4_22119 [Corchorus olitorius]
MVHIKGSSSGRKASTILQGFSWQTLEAKAIGYRELLSTRCMVRTPSLELFLSNRQIARRGKC